MTLRMLNLKFVLVIALTAVLAVAVACAGEDDPTAAPAAQVAPAAPAAPAAVAAPAAPAAVAAPAAPAAPTVDTSGLLSSSKTAVAKAAALAAEQAMVAKQVGLVELPELVVPAAALAATASGEQFFNFIVDCCGSGNFHPWGHRVRNYGAWAFRPAFTFNKENKLVQGFATGYTVSEDGKTYQLHINPDAIFTDGTKVTAAQVKRAYEYQFQPENQEGWGSTVMIAWRLIEGGDAVIEGDREDATGIVVIDDETLEFTLEQATPSWPGRLAVHLQGMFRADLAWDQGIENFFLNPVGVGPYTTVGDPDNKTITLTATDNWWGDPPLIQGALGRWVLEQETKLIMFENGDVDVISARPQDNPGVYDPSHPLFSYLVKIPEASVAFARINTSKPPFDDINLRRALAAAVPFEKITKAVIGPGGGRQTGIFQSSIACWDPNYQGHEFDVEKAKQYLAMSKYKTADNVPMIAIRSYPGFWNLWFVAWQAAWKENLGIEMNVHVMEAGQELPTDINMYASSAGAHVPDAGYLTYGIAHSGGGGAQHVDDELDAKIERADALALDDPGRCGAFQEIEREFMDKVYLMPMNVYNSHWLVQPWVQGFETSGSINFVTLPFMKLVAR